MQDIRSIMKEGYTDPFEEMQDLCTYLNLATEAYDRGEPLISDRRWDDRYYRLCQLEAVTEMILPESPTQKIFFEIKDKLNKITHDHPMLSLAKTKDIDELKSFLRNRPWVAMGKMDGLTCSLTYEQGVLVRAETRGNGIEGEDILHNMKVNLTIPQTIPYKGRVVIDGEVISTYKNFERFKDMFKNPRNFAAGSIRLLNAKESRDRFLTFVAWDVIEPFTDLPNDLIHQLGRCEDYGFHTPPIDWNVDHKVNIETHEKYEVTNNRTVEEAIEHVKGDAEMSSYPIDGVVFKFNDLSLRESLGSTSHHFNNAIAYKFFDELYETHLKDIEWSMGRTGVLTPIAVFEPVEADGSIIERASMHNYSWLKDMCPHYASVGDTLQVYKANMIIPQVETWTKTENNLGADIFLKPFVCPVCGKPVEIVKNNDVENIVCTNPACEGKLINRLDHYLGIKGINAKGISKATLEKLIEWGWVNDICDLYHLEDYRDIWIQKDGFGVKSVDKIIESIKEASKELSFEQFICALGIPLVGSTVSKQLGKEFISYYDFRKAVNSKFDFYNLPNFGPEKHSAIMNFDYNEGDRLADFYVTFAEKTVEDSEVQSLEGVTVVITGKLTTYKNRAALQSDIEKHGGKVTGSVSKNTNFLINNDKESSSSKNVSAKKLGIPIISEAEFKEKFLT